MGLVSQLYKLARISNDISTIGSGNPKRIGKRAANKWAGRKLIKKLWFK